MWWSSVLVMEEMCPEMSVYVAYVVYVVLCPDVSRLNPPGRNVAGRKSWWCPDRPTQRLRALVKTCYHGTTIVSRAGL